MKKIKQKDIIKHQQKKEDILNKTAIPEEKIDYVKYMALQIVFGTIALIAMMIILYVIRADTTNILLLVIAYFPYIYIKRDSPKNLHILSWSIYGAILVFGLFR